MRLLIDTHILAWFVAGDRRLPLHARNTMIDANSALLVSSVIAWEYADLHQRGRLPQAASLSVVLEILGAEVIGLPLQIWQMAASLPDIHRDPVDRMLIAHAIHDDLTIVTADDDMRRYSVRSLW